jgi:hypothetical protein
MSIVFSCSVKYISCMARNYGNQWVKAIDVLMAKHGWSINQLESRDVMHRSQYGTMIKSVHGPTTATLAKILKAIGSSWKEWGETCEQIRPLSAYEFEPINKRNKQNGGNTFTYVEKARKIS